MGIVINGSPIGNLVSGAPNLKVGEKTKNKIKQALSVLQSQSFSGGGNGVFLKKGHVITVEKRQDC